MEKRITAGARATITVEVFNLGSWGPECTVDQILRQAKEVAEGKLDKLFREHGKGDIRQVGPATVRAIIAESE